MLAKLRARLTPVNVGVLAVLILATAGYAFAAGGQQSATGGTITACVSRSGTVRIVSASRRCGRTARRVAWSKQGPRGFTGPRGAQGARGARGARGSTGARGAQGPAGPAGTFPEQLPSGRTLRGVYDVSGLETNNATPATQGGAVTFSSSLAAAPTVHFVAQGQAPPAQCPGNVTSPAAAAGHLCVYEGGQTARGALTIIDPTTQATAGAARWGFGLQLEPSSTAISSSFSSHGSWAVTAP